MCRPPSSGCVRRRACGLPYPTSGRRSRPSVALHVGGAPRNWRPGRCLPLPTMLIVRRWLWCHRPETAPGPAGDRPFASPPRRRSNSDHAGKSSYLGEIDYRFLTFQTGYRFSGSRLTSLLLILLWSLSCISVISNNFSSFPSGRVLFTGDAYKMEGICDEDNIFICYSICHSGALHPNDKISN